MLNFQRLERQIMHDEGFSSEPYLDTVGVPTIGYGATSLLGNRVTLETPKISLEAAREALRGHLYGALINAQQLFKTFDMLHGVRQEALVNMAYNLGRNRLSLFKDLIAATENLDYPAMAEAAKDSKWYGQVGHRANRIVDALRYGTWDGP